MMKYFNFLSCLVIPPCIFGLIVAAIMDSAFLGWVFGLLGLAYGVHTILTVKKDTE